MLQPSRRLAGPPCLRAANFKGASASRSSASPRTCLNSHRMWSLRSPSRLPTSAPAAPRARQCRIDIQKKSKHDVQADYAPINPSKSPLSIKLELRMHQQARNVGAGVVIQRTDSLYRMPYLSPTLSICIVHSMDSSDHKTNIYIHKTESTREGRQNCLSPCCCRQDTISDTVRVCNQLVSTYPAPACAHNTQRRRTKNEQVII